MRRTPRRFVIDVATKVPNYAGRNRAEAAFTKAFAPITQAIATRWTFATVLRCLGYWLVWTQIPGRRAEMVDRGWLSRAASFKWEAEFRELFDCSVEDFDPSKIRPFFLGPEEETVTPPA